MKRVLGVAVVALAVWGGVRAWQSASVGVNSQAVLAILIGANLVLCLLVWYLARPASGAVKAMPFIALLMVAMLLDILPRLVWPAAEGIHRAGSSARMILTTGVIVTQIGRIVIQIRRRRSLHRGARPA
jgi:magnesium-transporting ATPase (P-type)